MLVFICCLLFYSKVDAKTWNFIAIEYSENSRDKTNHIQSQIGIPEGYTSFTVTSVSNMANQIESYMDAGDTIGTLEIRGHGKPGVQSVGGGTYSYRQSDKSIRIDNIAEWQNSLSPLKGRFESDGKIRLLGCKVGANEEGAQLLYELQDFLETDAEGAVDYVFVLFQEDYNEYGDVQVSLYPSSNPPDPMTPSWVLITLLAYLKPQSIPTLSEWKQIFLTLLMLSLVMGFIPARSSRFGFLSSGNVSGIAGLNMLSFNKRLFCTVIKGIGIATALGLISAKVLLGHLSTLDITGTIFCSPLVAYILHLIILFIRDYKINSES
jgi:hypothetical protein